MMLRGLTAAIYDAIIRAECPPDVFGRETQVRAHTERLLAVAPRYLRLALVLGLWGLALTVLPRRITALAPERLRTHLLRLRLSRWSLLREAVVGLRSMAILGYYELGEIQARMAYDPPAWLAKVKAERRERYGVETGLPGETL